MILVYIQYIFISLIIDGVKHLFTVQISMHMLSWAPLCFCQGGHNSFLYILDASLLSDVHWKNIFPLVYGLSFQLLALLSKQHLYLINKIHLPYLKSTFPICLFYLKKDVPCTRS